VRYFNKSLSTNFRSGLFCEDFNNEELHNLNEWWSGFDDKKKKKFVKSLKAISFFD
jgi:hypothetical protein